MYRLAQTHEPLAAVNQKFTTILLPMLIDF